MQRGASFRVDLERDVVPFLLCACAVLFPLGSTAQQSVRNVAGPARWIVLVLFVVVELVAIVRGPRRWWRELRVGWYHAVWAAFLVLALASAIWSVTPSSSAKHAVSMALLAVAAFGSVWRYARRPDAGLRIAVALGIGMAITLVASLIVGAASPSTGRQTNILDYKPQYRWQGVFESPNELGLEALLFFPLALVPALAADALRRRLIAGAAALAFALAILSGTRSSTAWIVAVALVVVACRRPGVRAVAECAVIIAAVGAAALVFAHRSVPQGITIVRPPVVQPTTPAPTVSTSTETKTTKTTAGPTPTTTAATHSASWFRSMTVKSLSGRTEAWTRAAFEIGRRPIGGWGFGTEQIVIEVFRLRPDPHLSKATMDRIRTRGQPSNFVEFAGGFVENSYLGCTLQLGLLGALILVLQALFPAVAGVRALRRPDVAGAALGALFVTALAAAITESFLWSAGNLATVPVWAAAALLVRTVGRRSAG